MGRRRRAGQPSRTGAWRPALRAALPGGRRRVADRTFQGLLEAAPDAIVVVDAHGTIRLVNRQTEVLFGWDRADLLGQQLEVLIPTRLAARHPRLRDGYVTSPRVRPMGAGLELAAVRRDGTEFPVDISLSPLETAEGTFVSAAIRDVTARRAAQEELAHQATHDALTGLPNRVLLADRLHQMLQRSRRTGVSVTAVFLDIDRFKVINDSQGHSAGDALLRTVAGRLAATVRGSDTVARFGGDEFVVVAEDADLTELGRRLAEAVAEPVVLPDGTELRVSASLGMAVAGLDDDAESLLRDADAAMYEAKERGRDQVLLFDAAMRQGATARMQTERDLRRALAGSDELALWYQPVHDLTTGRPVAVEALLRWHHPERGLVPPSEVIPVAEETGLIVPLGARLLRTACCTVAGWPAPLDHLDVSVNLSARQLLAPGLAESVAQALVDSGLPASRLCLEITESVLLGDASACARVLQSLKALGVRLAVDDFGTGYSSLTYLKRFPVDTLKIDRSFVEGLCHPEHDRADRAIVAGIVDLAHAFGLTTVAEGVETAEQLERLRQLGCEQVQGFHLGRPVPAEDLVALLSAADVPPLPGLRVPQPRAGAQRVLVVEDDSSVRQLLQLVLDTEGDFQVVGAAEDGREAVALARHLRPDVVLLDLAMPGVGGLEALPLLHAVAPQARIVVVSGLTGDGVRTRAEREGALAFWDKGRDATGLPDYLRQLLAVHV